MSTPYVHSGYERRESDHYPTIDGRCVQALVERWIIGGLIVDCCAPNGSGIVDWLHERGYHAQCRRNVEAADLADWVVTNPPYARDVVDEIVGQVVARVAAGRHRGCAFLMRANWDLAAKRAALFASPLYRGQIRMRFRPWWSEERKAQPIHSYVFHVWSHGAGEPVIRYWP